MTKFFVAAVAVLGASGLALADNCHAVQQVQAVQTYQQAVAVQQVVVPVVQQVVVPQVTQVQLAVVPVQAVAVQQVQYQAVQRVQVVRQVQAVNGGGGRNIQLGLFNRAPAGNAGGRNFQLGLINR